MTAIDLARKYVANLPPKVADGEPELHEAIAHLTGVLAALDEQKPVAYVSAAKLERLQDHRINSMSTSISSTTFPGCAAVYAYPLTPSVIIGHVSSEDKAQIEAAFASSATRTLALEVAP